MSSLLLNTLKKNTNILSNGSLDSIKTFSAPTGFTVIDIIGGNYEVNSAGVHVINGGLLNRAMSCVGESATGKTTIEVQKGASSVDWWNRKYPQYGGLSDFIIYNLENNLTIERVKALTKWTNIDCLNHLTLVNGSTSTKEIYDSIVNIAHIKEQNKDKYIVDTDLIDINGDPVKTYIFTYVLIDSIPSMKNMNSIDDYEKDRDGNIKLGDEISGNMDAMREAKENTEFIFKVKPLCEKYGIVLIMINHVVEQVKLSMFDVPTRYLPSLKPGKKLKGSKELVFQSFAISDITVAERLNEKNPIYGDDIVGIIVNYITVKSKTSNEGISYRMVFDGATGYRPELSDFEYLFTTSNRYGIEGSPASMGMSILPEIRFTRRTLFEKCKEHPLLSRAIQFTAKMKMLFDIIDGRTPIDMSRFIELPYEERVAIILNYTNPYPGYERAGYHISEDVMKVKLIGDAYLSSANDIDLSNSYLTDLMIEMMFKDKDGLSYVPIINDWIDPLTNFEEACSLGESLCGKDEKEYVISPKIFK